MIVGRVSNAVEHVICLAALIWFRALFVGASMGRVLDRYRLACRDLLMQIFFRCSLGILNETERS